MSDPETFKFDVRVRDRMLSSGRLKADELEKLLVALPDLEAEAEPLGLGQPALSHPDADEFGDDDEEEDEGEAEAEEAEADDGGASA